MIIWGKKIVRRHLGYVADFCPICGNARAFALTRVGSAGHVYYITSGDGDLVGYERACLTCTTALRGDPARYVTLARQPLSISDLVAQTFPNFAEANQDVLAQEKAVRLDPTMLSAVERHNLIMLPFMLLSVRVSTWFSENHFTTGSRFMQNEVLPILARGLRRVRPTEQELQAALSRLVQLKEVIGSKVKLADLMAELKRPPRKDAAPAVGKAGGYVAGAVGDEGRTRNNAGRLMRILAYLIAAAVVGVGLLMLVPGGDSPSSVGALVVCWRWLQRWHSAFTGPGLQ